MKSSVRESAPVGGNTTSLCLDDDPLDDNSALDHLTAARTLRNRCATVIAPSAPRRAEVDSKLKYGRSASGKRRLAISVLDPELPGAPTKGHKPRIAVTEIEAATRTKSGWAGFLISQPDRHGSHVRIGVSGVTRLAPASCHRGQLPVVVVGDGHQAI